MIFNSFQFLWLFPLIFLIYYGWMNGTAKLWGKPKGTRFGNYLLILLSYGLYLQWEPKYALVLLGVTFIAYFSARIIEDQQAFGKKKYLVVTGATLILLPLLIFKYTGFICNTVQSILGASSHPLEIKLIAPIGISFFTFQAVGYLFDVYHKRISAERNWWDFMLFVCFFPQIVSGPISKAQDLLPQIKAERSFCYAQARNGLQLLLWGMFLKLCIADRAEIYVDSVYRAVYANSGLQCFIASIFYTLQIYGDFAGYSIMAVGVGKILGFELINNFNRPYLATSVTDFWRRWHISLTQWLTTHVYIALGGNRCSKVRQYLNILLTFLVSGLWHGANWTFVFWGALHGVFQIVEKCLGLDPKGRFAIQKNTSKVIKGIRILITFLLVNFAWIFFRMHTLEHAFTMIGKILTFEGGFSMSVLGLSDLVYLLLCLIPVVIYEVLQEYYPATFQRCASHLWVRWGTYICIASMILLVGVLNSGQFIYASF